MSIRAVGSGLNPYSHNVMTGQQVSPGATRARRAGNWAGYLQNRLASAQARQQLGQIGQEGKLASQGLSALVNSYNQAFSAAKAANEERYQEMLGIADQTTGQRMADIRGDYEGQRADVLQNLARLGMANTTVAPTLTAGVEREKQASLNRAADLLQGTKLGIMERRTDEYPNANLITSLFGMLGQGLGGGGTQSAGLGRLVNALGGLQLG